MLLWNTMAQANVEKTCPNCGTKNSASAQFCSHCGSSLTNTGAMPTKISPSSGTQTVANSLHSAPTVVGPGASARRLTGALREKEILGGRYRIVHLVGKGGFGAVYEATDDHFQARRVVAIKE